ncbi:laminin subunit beta-1 [Aplysia californica]|uniref:Laminin subunit beta-1 n=2 Tax=Aplysia californica TaxID=6500 RepID=A0ABM0K794_APLCA|nr:laminin subunit beta-1 [Aplysia californica]
MDLLFSYLLILALVHGSSGQGRRQPKCEQGSCYPATGDLLIGRAQNLSASSTCGLDRPQRYCVVSYLEKDTKCFTCDSRQPWREGFTEQSHRIENIVSSFKESKNRWWQAKTGVENVYIQLDLEAEFHFTHLIMTFKTFRPKAMLIERSFDFGRTWKVYRYFAQNCDKSFPGVAKRVVNSLSDVICEERYSAETPSTDGEVIFRVLPPFIPIPDPYSEAVQDLLKLTNLRINFTELHTLGDTLLDSRSEIKEKYYYALYDVTVRGSCSCYGHASRCLPVPGYNRSQETSRAMVHGQCECTHNTKGRNCEMCEDFYHDHPWRPARPNQPNVCKRCNCNNHASQCHFDAAKFTASGEVSGGVCDNCMHNTRGVNCQDCKKFYYQDPSRDIRDPEICQPCDCDSFGSEQNGLCEQVTDEIAGTVAGRCRCKAFVRGPRCDQCADNYWNLQKDNPLGCQACTCNPDGTIPDLGCDDETGLCRCKRYVTGKDCDECYPGFYGLSADDRYGCKSCDCDIGGAVRYTCDQATGQCECRHHIRGMRCTEVDPGFFFAHLDHYKFEAEYGTGSGNARVYIREPVAGSPSYWTGPGYMKVTEGDSIEFTVNNLPFSTYYDIVVRYDPRMPEVFEDVRVTVIRPNAVDPDGLCGDFSPRDDLKTMSLPPGARFQVVSPPSCLEQDTTYTVRIDFNTYISGRQSPEATLLIDSILLVPSPDYIPIYQGAGLPDYMKNEFLYSRCDVLQFPSLKQELPEQCQRHTFSISAVLHNGALECNCDVTGSLSLECNPSGGQCECKPNVVGRRCDQCAPGTYGFGPSGCRPCDCHEFGARDNFCDDRTGQCTCIQNVGGRACDQCLFGFWGFPQCRQCQCNGNADVCDPLTGACINCRNFTSGSFCERCEDGYYGDPRIGARIPCRPCMCPGGPGSPAQHADTCSFDPRSQQVFCNCRTGYTGASCESCIENYYGDPSQVGGQCQPCVCNNNINPDDPGSCDGSTGECLRCLYNTEGFACEHCRTGYYGDATLQNCARCVCNQLGTDVSLGECDRVTGQCPCLPNVVGQSCDQCAADHWDMAGGVGCTACDCDPSGSLSSQCNEFDGQCSCVPGRGGPKCADCEDYFYGDPLDQCIPCDCNPQGSSARQCDRRTGQCVCVEGVTGFKCDRCARGTTGDLPNCVPCGECFDNWDSVIQDLRGLTHDIVKRANDVSVTGAIKAFDEEFRLMQDNIDEIKRILASVDFTQVDIQDIQNMLDTVRANLTENTRTLNDVDKVLSQTNARVKKGSLKIQLLKSKVENLKALAMELQKNATNIQIQEVGGAFEKIKEAERESREAQVKVDGTAQILDQSARVRGDTERLLAQRENRFNEQLDENRDALDRLENDVRNLGGDLSEINNMVCGGQGDPCSSLCGGGGCGMCGGTGCNGAVTIAQTAFSLAQRAEDLLKAKTANATDVLIPRIQEAKRDAMGAKADAQSAFDEASKAKNMTESTKADLKALLTNIRDFLIGNETATPEDIEKIAEEVLNMQIPMNPDKIRELAEKINRAVESLTDIDKILADTKGSRDIAEELKRQAESASADAQDIRNTAQDVRDALDEAKRVQASAAKAIEMATQDIQDAEDDFNTIRQETGTVTALTEGSLNVLEELKKKLSQLIKRYTALKEDTLNRAEDATEEATRLAKGAYDKALQLDATYNDTAEMVSDKYKDTKGAKERAEKLKKRADAIYNSTETKMNELKEIEKKITGNEGRLNKLSDEIKKLNDRMDVLLTEIRDKAKFYETC